MYKYQLFKPFTYSLPLGPPNGNILVSLGIMTFSGLNTLSANVILLFLIGLYYDLGCGVFEICIVIGEFYSRRFYNFYKSVGRYKRNLGLSDKSSKVY